MARLCTYFDENPYTPCMNLAVKGTYRCPEHPKTKPHREGDMTNAVRESVMARDHHKCVECGQPATEVNHIVPFSRFAPDEKWKANMPTNLEALCLKHHAIKTAHQRKEDIVLADPNDTSTSARNRKKQRRRKQGFYY